MLTKRNVWSLTSGKSNANEAQNHTTKTCINMRFGVHVYSLSH